MSINLTAKPQPSVIVETNAWLVRDDLGNGVEEGERVFVTIDGATIHIDASEDYLVEKLGAKVADIESWSGKKEQVFLLPNGIWVKSDDVEDYYIDVLGAQVFERTKLLPKQKEQHFENR